jgi:GxxExxY protein
MELNKLTEKIIGCAMKVHSHLGPGLLESVYEACLYHELIKEGLQVERQKPMGLLYDEIKLDIGYKIDLFVEGRVVVELKAVEEMHEIYTAQTLTYINLSKSEVGLLINFNVIRLKNGITRLIPKDPNYSPFTNKNLN